MIYQKKSVTLSHIFTFRSMITVIGATNVDIIATTKDEFLPHDSNPSRILMGIGGVGKNYAHNLRLLGQEVQLVTLFGADYFGDLCRAECKRLGIDVRLSATPVQSRCSIFMGINNTRGQLQAAAADVEVMEQHMTPSFLRERIEKINESDLVLIDANLPTESIAWLMDNCTARIMADTVSSKKATRIGDALRISNHGHLHTLKLNEIEAYHILGDGQDKDIAHIATLLVDMGVDHVYVTLGSRGVYYRSSTGVAEMIQAMPADKVTDTNGAGDAFLSGLAYAFAQGTDYPDNIAYAQRAANATVQVESVVNPQLAEYMKQDLNLKINIKNDNGEHQEVLIPLS